MHNILSQSGQTFHLPGAGHAMNSIELGHEHGYSHFVCPDCIRPVMADRPYGRTIAFKHNADHTLECPDGRHLQHTLSHTVLTNPEGQTNEAFGLGEESTLVSAEWYEILGYQIIRLGSLLPVLMAVSLNLGKGITEQVRFYPISRSAFEAGDIDAAFSEVRATMSTNNLPL